MRVLFTYAMHGVKVILITFAVKYKLQSKKNMLGSGDERVFRSVVALVFQSDFHSKIH